jgi:ferritin-like metal-binding protein YciE
MGIISEDSLDRSFNNELAKIQDSIERLEKIVHSFNLNGVKIVNSQKTAVQYIIEDLKKIHTLMKT